MSDELKSRGQLLLNDGEPYVDLCISTYSYEWNRFSQSNRGNGWAEFYAKEDAFKASLPPDLSDEEITAAQETRRQENQRQAELIRKPGASLVGKTLSYVMDEESKLHAKYYADRESRYHYNKPPTDLGSFSVTRGGKFNFGQRVIEMTALFDDHRAPDEPLVHTGDEMRINVSQHVSGDFQALLEDNYIID